MTIVWQFCLVKLDVAINLEQMSLKLANFEQFLKKKKKICVHWVNTAHVQDFGIPQCMNLPKLFCVCIGHLHGENLEVGTSGTSVSFLEGSERKYILNTS
jgi:hypothetical protein